VGDKEQISLLREIHLIVFALLFKVLLLAAPFKLRRGLEERLLKYLFLTFFLVVKIIVTLMGGA
jgi:hypothetical protein